MRLASAVWQGHYSIVMALSSHAASYPPLEEGASYSHLHLWSHFLEFPDATTARVVVVGLLLFRNILLIQKGKEQ